MNAIFTGHATFLLPPVPRAHDQPARYCAEVTSQPITIRPEPRHHPCARQPFGQAGDCETCGVAWARHGGGTR